MAMRRLLIKDVILNADRTDVVIAGNRFEAIGPQTTVECDEVIACDGRMAIVPPFYNAHTHAAMTLLRGYADDVELAEWLTDHIWPAEAQLTSDDIYAGSRVAILEMIKSGTVFFNDMYWDQLATARAADEMGVRAALGLLYLSGPDGTRNPRSERCNAELLELEPDLPDRIQITEAPHSVYTVPEVMLRAAAESAADEGRLLHIHVSETSKENADCLAQTGRSPVAYLDDLGVIGPHSVLAHCVHLSDADRRILTERDAVIAHLPASNMKLCSGQFDHAAARAAGLRLTLGTDGASSNNSLSMLTEMKLASLSAKIRSGSPTEARDHEVYAMATVAGARTFGIDAGEIAEGRLADALLIDLDQPSLVADHSLTSNLVYAADSSVIDTVICDGTILMSGRRVPGEEEILEQGRAAAARIRARR
jgi:5-methylthioadenosine/S-adenosylhomocysteine deaminase